MSVSSLFPSKNNIFRPNYSLEVSYALFVKPVPKKKHIYVYIYIHGPPKPPFSCGVCGK